MIATVTARELLRRTWALVRAHLGQAVFAVAIMAALATMLDQNPNAGLLAFAPFFASLFASIYFQYEVTRGALEGLELLPGGYRTRRLGALLGLCLLTQVSILFGIVFFIIPGIILLVRWLLAVPILIVEEAGILESLQLSWEETTGRFRPLLAVILIIYGPVILLSLGAVLFVRGGLPTLAESLVVNVATSITYVVGWYAAVAAYAMRRGGTEGLAEVFA